MAILTVEGVVESGQIRLRDGVTLPEDTKVYVVVPGAEATHLPHIRTPRLARPEQGSDFAKQVVEVTPDAEL